MTNTTNTHPEGITCGWLVRRLGSWTTDPEWYADGPEDAYEIVECGEGVDMDSRHALCEFHQGAMDMDEREFEAISERHDGYAFS